MKWQVKSLLCAQLVSSTSCARNCEFRSSFSSYISRKNFEVSFKQNVEKEMLTDEVDGRCEQSEGNEDKCKGRALPAASRLESFPEISIWLVEHLEEERKKKRRKSTAQLL